jgi:hypothetical protein
MEASRRASPYGTQRQPGKASDYWLKRLHECGPAPEQGDKKGLEFPQQDEKPYRRHPGGGRGPVAFALISISWETAWIPAFAGMTKSLAIFRRFSHQRTLFYQPDKLRHSPGNP